MAPRQPRGPCISLVWRHFDAGSYLDWRACGAELCALAELVCGSAPLGLAGCWHLALCVVFGRTLSLRVQRHARRTTSILCLLPFGGRLWAFQFLCLFQALSLSFGPLLRTGNCGRHLLETALLRQTHPQRRKVFTQGRPKNHRLNNFGLILGRPKTNSIHTERERNLCTVHISVAGKNGTRATWTQLSAALTSVSAIFCHIFSQTHAPQRPTFPNQATFRLPAAWAGRPRRSVSLSGGLSGSLLGQMAQMAQMAANLAVQSCTNER